jgi:hypothetical protein
MHPIIDIERGGHRITLDEKDHFFRVNCNGVTNATFNIAPVGEVKALQDALAFLAGIEKNALAFQKIHST